MGVLYVYICALSVYTRKIYDERKKHGRTCAFLEKKEKIFFLMILVVTGLQLVDHKYTFSTILENNLFYIKKLYF